MYLILFEFLWNGILFHNFTIILYFFETNISEYSLVLFIYLVLLFIHLLAYASIIISNFYNLLFLCMLIMMLLMLYIIYLCLCLSIYLSIYLSIDRSICLSIYQLSIYIVGPLKIRKIRSITVLKKCLVELLIYI